MRPRVAVLLVACPAFALLVLAACDDDGTSSSSSGSSGSTSSTSSTSSSTSSSSSGSVPSVDSGVDGSAASGGPTECVPPRPRAAATQCASRSSGMTCTTSLTTAGNTICTVLCSGPCPEGFVCAGGLCRRPCELVSECGAGYTECAARGDGPKVCN